MCLRPVQTFDALSSVLFQDFCAKIAGSHVAMHKHNSRSVCARALFQCSKDLSRLVVRNDKKICWGFVNWCEWCHMWRTFRPPWPTSPGPGLKPLDGSISLKVLLETRLQYESFDTLDDLLGFRVQK